LRIRSYDDRDSYRAWAQSQDTLNDTDEQAIRERVRRLPRLPLFSILLFPTPDTAASAAQLVASLNRQLYPNWELLQLGRAGETDLQIDGRHRIITTNDMPPSDLSRFVNVASALAEGEFVLPMPPDVVLRQDALFELAIVVGQDPAAELLYTDEDHISNAGDRCQPHFKTGWDPDLALGQDSIGLLVAYRKTLLQQLGEIRLLAATVPLAIYELSLQVAFAASSSHIHHIPAVLCHRHDSTHTSTSWDAEGAREIVRKHLTGSGISARVVAAPLVPSWNWILRELPNPAPFVSIIVPTRDRAGLLERCVVSVLSNTTYPNLELLIVDNDSCESKTIALLQYLSEDPRVKIQSYPGPFNFSALNNRAAREARGEVLILLNNDTASIRPDWLREMVSHAIRPDVGAVGAKLLYENEQVQHAGMVFQPGVGPVHQFRFADRFDGGPNGELALTRAVSIVTGACLAVRRSLFLAVGGLDEQLSVAFNDVDLCMRLSDRGYRIIWTPVAELFHFEGMSRGYDDTPEKRTLATRELGYFSRRWGSLLQGDPFRNANLDYLWDAVTLAPSSRRRRSWL
jgi:GT2 family glycosyltransferase